eukprot:RCo048858
MSSGLAVICKNVFPVAAILAILGVVLALSRLVPFHPIRWDKGGLGSESRSCGIICSANVTSKTPGRWFSTLRKEPLNCRGLIARLGDSVTQTAKERLREVSSELMDAYTLGRKYPFHPAPASFDSALAADWNFVGGTTAWPSICGRNRVPPNYNDASDLFGLLHRFRGSIANRTGLVVGSRTPWVECFVLGLGARRVFTLEYGKVLAADPRIITMTPDEVSAAYLQRDGRGLPALDFVVSYSSIEHSGLTRYHDAVNPFGDFEVMAQVHCLTSPDALAFIGVPINMPHESTVWPLHRVYGPARLPHLMANWDCVDGG